VPNDVESSDPGVCMFLSMFVYMCMLEVFPDSWMYLCMHACFYDVLVKVETYVSLKASV